MLCDMLKAAYTACASLLLHNQPDGTRTRGARMSGVIDAATTAGIGSVTPTL
jgi:hypothetical protein